MCCTAAISTDSWSPPMSPPCPVNTGPDSCTGRSLASPPAGCVPCRPRRPWQPAMPPDCAPPCRQRGLVRATGDVRAGVVPVRRGLGRAPVSPPRPQRRLERRARWERRAASGRLQTGGPRKLSTGPAHARPWRGRGCGAGETSGAGGAGGAGGAS